jgi:hypothetical protein
VSSSISLSLCSGESGLGAGVPCQLSTERSRAGDRGRRDACVQICYLPNTCQNNLEGCSLARGFHGEGSPEGIDDLIRKVGARFIFNLGSEDVPVEHRA